MTTQHDKATRWQFGLRLIFAAVLLIAAVLPPCIGLYRAWHFAAIGAQLQRVNVGMTKAELQDRWGPPHATSTLSWTYWLGGSRVDVHFDDSGIVSQIDS
jgi:hypothetical protein